MNYINKKEMAEALMSYQELTDDLNDKWLLKYKSAPRRKLSDEQRVKFFEERDEFKIFKYAQFKSRKLLLETESEDDKVIRTKALRKVKENIATMFSLIIDGVLTLPEFNNQKLNQYQMLKSDMKSDALWTTYNYIDRYDTRRKNPFSYFTEMAKNACRQKKDEYLTNKQRYPSLDFVENMDGGGGLNIEDHSYMPPMSEL
tara:strand:+ start:7776 stop:8378 length:603 start_codon:yes stop_codon:yes gene_type:complete